MQFVLNTTKYNHIDSSLFSNISSDINDNVYRQRRQQRKFSYKNIKNALPLCQTYFFLVKSFYLESNLFVKKALLYYMDHNLINFVQ